MLLSDRINIYLGNYPVITKLGHYKLKIKMQVEGFILFLVSIFRLTKYFPKKDKFASH